MSSNKDIEDDEYVAKLLADDAKKSSVRYATMGLSALLPKRPTNAAPRPNTRFLKSIIRETDSHNAALKKKEELETRIRWRKLKEESLRTRLDRDFEDGRERKRRRVVDEEEEQARSGRSRRYRSDNRRGDDYPERSRSRDRDTRGGGRHDERREKHRRGRHLTSSRNKGASLRSRSRSRDGQGSDRKDRSRKDRRRDGATRPRSDSSSPSDRDHSGKQKSHDLTSSPPLKRKRRRESKGERVASPDNSSSSDPLESIVGPQPPHPRDSPPIRSRGRGAYRPTSSAMDEHFSQKYDPKLDIHPENEVDEEREDWDLALEALRDRTMWKQKHAERLREAGFGDADIKKWEESGKEKNADDVRWKGKGEAREWDLGKTTKDQDLGPPKEDGLEAAWKRKDGGFLKSFKKALG